MRINTFDDYQIAAAASKVKKTYQEERRQQIAEDLGGVLWYIAAICTDLSLNMGDIARQNIDLREKR